MGVEQEENVCNTPQTDSYSLNEPIWFCAHEKRDPVQKAYTYWATDNVN